MMLRRCIAVLALSACGATPSAVDSGAGEDSGAMTDAGPSGELDAGAVVTTLDGRLRGVVEGSTRVFRGIPYAAAPVGPLRWQPPGPAAPWSGVRDAVSFGPSCPQRAADGGVDGQEDCLTLNLWTPAVPPSSPLPVLVFLHGGAHIAGSSSLPAYDGRALSEYGDVVVVTLNYRLGVLGFLAHPALGAENASHSSGNYGYLDQTAALRWVHDNIASFGGDPARVLLFGQSAGAYGVCMHLASPLSRGLFSRAMMLSGACTTMTLAQAESRGANVATALGCDGAADTAACLRDAPAARVAALPVNDGQASSAVAGPAVDGRFLTEAPFSALANATVPVVVSTTRDEFTNQLGLYGGTRPVNSAADYERLVRQLFGARADAVLGQYPAASYPSPTEAEIALFSDFQFTCPSRAVARRLALSAQPLWRVLFGHTVDHGPARSLRAAHGFDLVFGFRNFRGYVPTTEELKLADTVSDAWVRFARQGNLDWPRYDATRDNHTVLDEPLGSGEGFRSAFCDFWDL